MDDKPDEKFVEMDLSKMEIEGPKEVKLPVEDPFIMIGRWIGRQ
jgi:hypothetical protein